MEEQFGWRVRAHRPEAARVLDTIDLHFLRRARQRRVEEGAPPRGMGDLGLVTDDSVRELASIHRSDLSLVTSEAELALLRDRFGVAAEALELSRLFCDEPEPGLPFRERRDFVVIGNYRHAPNLDAFRLLHGGLWKRIRELASARGEIPELHVYGAYPTKELMELDDAASGFRVKGWARDPGGARQTLGRYRVNLAPLRFGAGIKGKIVDGWEAGTPCVSTPVGAEGMTGGMHFGGEVAELEGGAFAEAATALYTDPARWEQARDQGAAILRRFYCARAGARAWVERLERLVAERDAVRERNFTGAMLWHHQHRSTEYFSRWIEEKNRGKR
jgi:glycosyltransferase involved in cell wall biosynthesis